MKNSLHFVKEIKTIVVAPLQVTGPDFFYPKSYFFGDLKPHAKFWNPMITPSWRKVSVGEREKRKNAVNSGHLVP